MGGVTYRFLNSPKVSFITVVIRKANLTKMSNHLPLRVMTVDIQFTGNQTWKLKDVKNSIESYLDSIDDTDDVKGWTGTLWMTMKAFPRRRWFSKSAWLKAGMVQHHPKPDEFTLTHRCEVVWKSCAHSYTYIQKSKTRSANVT